MAELSFSGRSQLVEGRTCGDCTVCCEYFNIDQPDLQKPAGVMCKHATATGCGVHPNWPKICQEFFCLWRQSPVLNDAARPDRLGVIFWTTGKPNPAVVFEHVYVVGSAVSDPRALDQLEVQRLVESFSRDGALPIFLIWGGHQHLIHPGPELADAIMHPDQTPYRHLVEQGRAWLARYAPYAREYSGRDIFAPR